MEGKVLFLVDDDAFCRQTVGMMCKGKGVEVITAVDGVDALSVFDANQEKIGAILMDFNMPNMDGLEATQEIRKREAALGKSFVIFGLTAGKLDGVMFFKDGGEENVKRAIDSGMNALKTKPLNIATLMDVIGSFK